MTFDGLMALELVDGGLDGVRGELHLDPVFHLDDADVEALRTAMVANGLPWGASQGHVSR